jgi:hypothetical protein
MADSTEELTAPERRALMAARSTATQSLPIGLFLILTGLVIAQGISVLMFLLLVLNATMAWERLGFTRLLRRKNPPVVIEHTLS